MWFFDAGLLPEVPEDPDHCGDPQVSNSPYPHSLLLPLYKNKRDKMKRLLSHFPIEFVEAPCLIVDGLCRQLGDVLEANFERDGGDGLFPPPSLHALLSLYLISSEQRDSSRSAAAASSCVDHLKHRIVQYTFLDMASYLANGDKWAAVLENLIKFPSAFSVPPSQIKLTQAFWLLDHEDYEEAVNMLLDPLISSNDIEPWQHRAVLVSLLAQAQPKLALKYSRIRRPPQRDLVDIQVSLS